MVFRARLGWLGGGVQDTVVREKDGEMGDMSQTPRNSLPD